MTAATRPARKTASQYRAECRARAKQTTGLGVLPQPTEAQRAAMNPANDPQVRAILADWAYPGA